MAAGVTALAMAGSAAQAAMLASDNASGSNNTSGAALTTGATGGYGFGAWTVVASDSNSPPYAGEYADTSSKAIATSSNSWAVYANSGTATATPRIDLFRPFNSALASGQSFTVALESDSVGADVYGTPAATYHSNGLPAYGFSLQTGSAATVTSGTTPMTVGTSSYNAGSYTNPNAIFTLSFTELGPTETLNGVSNSAGYALETNITDAHGTTSVLSTGSNAINETQIGAGINASFALGNAGAYTLTLSSVGATPAVLATYTGTVNGTINGTDLFDQATAQNGYFNSLSIANTTVPEPATIGLFIAAGAGLLLIRRRRTA
jgi:hypothetical protein